MKRDGDEGYLKPKRDEEKDDVEEDDEMTVDDDEEDSLLKDVDADGAEIVKDDVGRRKREKKDENKEGGDEGKRRKTEKKDDESLLRDGREKERETEIEEDEEESLLREEDDGVLDRGEEILLRDGEEMLLRGEEEPLLREGDDKERPLLREGDKEGPLLREVDDEGEPLLREGDDEEEPLLREGDDEEETLLRDGGDDEDSLIKGDEESLLREGDEDEDTLLRGEEEEEESLLREEEAEKDAPLLREGEEEAEKDAAVKGSQNERTVDDDITALTEGPAEKDLPDDGRPGASQPENSDTNAEDPAADRARGQPGSRSLGKILIVKSPARRFRVVRVSAKGKGRKKDAGDASTGDDDDEEVSEADREEKLPEILPPKRRRLLHPQRDAFTNESSVERFRREFPRHHWLTAANESGEERVAVTAEDDENEEEGDRMNAEEQAGDEDDKDESSVKNIEEKQVEVIKNIEEKQVEVVKNIEVEQLEDVENIEVRQVEVLKNIEVRQVEAVENIEVKQLEDVENIEARQVVLKNMEVRQVEAMENIEVRQVENQNEKSLTTENEKEEKDGEFDEEQSVRDETERILKDVTGDEDEGTRVERNDEETKKTMEDEITKTPNVIQEEIEKSQDIIHEEIVDDDDTETTKGTKDDKTQGNNEVEVVKPAENKDGGKEDAERRPDPGTVLNFIQTQEEFEKRKESERSTEKEIRENVAERIPDSEGIFRSYEVTKEKKKDLEGDRKEIESTGRAKENEIRKRLGHSESALREIYEISRRPGTSHDRRKPTASTYPAWTLPSSYANYPYYANYNKPLLPPAPPSSGTGIFGLPTKPNPFGHNYLTPPVAQAPVPPAPRLQKQSPPPAHSQRPFESAGQITNRGQCDDIYKQFTIPANQIAGGGGIGSGYKNVTRGPPRASPSSHTISNSTITISNNNTLINNGNNNNIIINSDNRILINDNNNINNTSTTKWYTTPRLQHVPQLQRPQNPMHTSPLIDLRSCEALRVQQAITRRALVRKGTGERDRVPVQDPFLYPAGRSHPTSSGPPTSVYSPRSIRSTTSNSTGQQFLPTSPGSVMGEGVLNLSAKTTGNPQATAHHFIEGLRRHLDARPAATVTWDGTSTTATATGLPLDLSRQPRGPTRSQQDAAVDYSRRAGVGAVTSTAQPAIPLLLSQYMYPILHKTPKKNS